MSGSMEDVGDDGSDSLSPYELLRLEKIKRNKAYFESLGLTSWAAKAKDSIQQTNKNKKRANVHKQKQRVKAGEERRSKRISGSSGGGGKKKGSNNNNNNNDDDNGLVMLSYASDDNTEVAVSQSKYHRGDGSSSVSAAKSYRSYLPDELTSSSPSPSSRPTVAFQQVNQKISLEQQDFSLTEQEMKILSQETMDERILGKFEEFLVYHNKISDQNRQKVMKQVTKLATGQGINYDSPNYGWKPDQYFMKGQKINLLSDFVDLLRQGKDCEDAYGRDHGNGWLLSHPLKKLLLFQQFCLQNPDFLASDSLLTDYYANDDDNDVDDDDDDDHTPMDETMIVSDGSSDDDNNVKSVSKATTTPPKTVKKRTSDATETSTTKRTKTEKGTTPAVLDDPKSLVGRHIAKKFVNDDGTDQIYFGKVTRYVAKMSWWKIKYEDGDSEEMDANELSQGLELYNNANSENNQPTSREKA